MGTFTCTLCGHLTTLAMTLPERNRIEINGTSDGTTHGCIGRFKDSQTMVVERGCAFDKGDRYLRLVVDGLVQTQPFAERAAGRHKVVRGEIRGGQREVRP